MTPNTPRKAVNAVPYAIPAVLAALLGGTYWHLITLRRALLRERVAARLDQAAAHREIAGLRDAAHEAARQSRREHQVLADAAAVIDTALAAAGTPTDQPRGGTDA